MIENEGKTELSIMEMDRPQRRLEELSRQCMCELVNCVICWRKLIVDNKGRGVGDKKTLRNATVSRE